MEKIVEKCSERAVNVRRLSATVAMAANQRGTAIQAGTLVSVTSISLAS